MKEIEGLMELPLTIRGEFLEAVMKGVEPKFKVTQEGDPDRMLKMRATLPNISTAHILSEINDLYDPAPKVTKIMSRTMARAMRRDLLDIEMSLCGGG